MTRKLDVTTLEKALKVDDDPGKTAERLSTVFQEVASTVMRHYLAKERMTDGANVTNYACAMLMAWCATASVNAVRRSEKDGQSMTRIDAARIFLEHAHQSAEEAILKAMAEVEQQEAEERLRYQQPAGEA